MPFAISDLRRQPQFFDIVADRIWQAWWQPSGFPRGYIAARLIESMADTSIPFALVAHDGPRFLGTASVIASDLEERPQLTPWVAAVWVEEDARKLGVGGTLVNRATEACFALGRQRVHLCARARMAEFYRRLGWTMIDRGVGPHELDVYCREASPLNSPP
jgi:GNAT superfamily N-acetyltransferase